ncbi:hypothetical protein NC651_027217 [Populus alba x Populus x berolinensis]|nr:hypothetical protein NC651_027217 [Populus alba x Populus x berolinensis]
MNLTYEMGSLKVENGNDSRRSFFTFSTGKVGELTMALSDLLWDDMVAGPERLVKKGVTIDIASMMPPAISTDDTRSCVVAEQLPALLYFSQERKQISLSHPTHRMMS